jgi:hypothetical protein
MIVPFHKEIVTRIFGRPVRVPVARVSEQRIDVDVAVYTRGVTPQRGKCRHVAIRDGRLRPADDQVLSRFEACIALEDAVRQGYRVQRKRGINDTRNISSITNKGAIRDCSACVDFQCACSLQCLVPDKEALTQHALRTLDGSHCSPGIPSQYTAGHLKRRGRYRPRTPTRIVAKNTIDERPLIHTHRVSDRISRIPFKHAPCTLNTPAINPPLVLSALLQARDCQ